MLLGQVEVLATLYGRVLVPSTVIEELRHNLAPAPVRNWADRLPAWIEVVIASGDSQIPHLDRGEADAIVLAADVHADVILLIDEHAGRLEARRRGLRVTGTLSVLDEADRAGLLRFEEAVAALRRTSFRVSTSVLEEIISRRSR